MVTACVDGSTTYQHIVKKDRQIKKQNKVLWVSKSISPKKLNTDFADKAQQKIISGNNPNTTYGQNYVCSLCKQLDNIDLGCSELNMVIRSTDMILYTQTLINVSQSHKLAPINNEKLSEIPQNKRQIDTHNKLRLTLNRVIFFNNSSQ